MKKIIFALASLALVGSSSTVVSGCGLSVICEPKPLYDDCFDQNSNNVTDQDSDSKQWIDINWISLFFRFLSNDIFPDSNSFYQNLNDKTTSELISDSIRGPHDEIWERSFEYDFTFLITNYDTINKNTIAQMQENDLKDKGGRAVYLFLNLPKIKVENIKNERNINFQFIFITKNANNTIIGNDNNNWFYWYDSKVINDWRNNANQYFFNLSLESESKNVVTDYF